MKKAAHLTNKAHTNFNSIQVMLFFKLQVNRDNQNKKGVPSALFFVQLFHKSVLMDETVRADSSLSAPIAV